MECAFHFRDKNVNALVACLYSHKLAITPTLRALCFNLGSAQRTGLQNFRHIHSVTTCDWMRIDKVEQTQGGHEPGRAFRSRGGKQK